MNVADYNSHIIVCQIVTSEVLTHTCLPLDLFHTVTGFAL